MRPSSLCFTLYGDYFRDLNLEVWVGSLITYLKAFDISPNLTRVTLSRMVQQEFLTSRRIGQKGYYRLSEKGKRRIMDGVARVYDGQEERWDRNWQVVHLDLSEMDKELRDRVKHELQWMGFGQLGKSTWVSPHFRYPWLKTTMEEYGLQDSVHVFTGAYEGMQAMTDLVNQAWDFDFIQEQYHGFLDEFGPTYQQVHQLGVKGELTPERAFVERTLLVHSYRKFLSIDPNLPRELLPPAWIGEQARKFFKDYHEYLSPLAEVYFYEHLEVAEVK